MCKFDSPTNHYSLDINNLRTTKNMEIPCLRVELLVSGDEGGAGDDFVANLLQSVEDVVRLRAELQPPAPLVPVLRGRTGLNTEGSNYI